MPKNGPGINGDGLYATADRRKERGTAVRETRIGAAGNENRAISHFEQASGHIRETRRPPPLREIVGAASADGGSYRKMVLVIGSG